MCCFQLGNNDIVNANVASLVSALFANHAREKN